MNETTKVLKRESLFLSECRIKEASKKFKVGVNLNVFKLNIFISIVAHS